MDQDGDDAEMQIAEGGGTNLPGGLRPTREMTKQATELLVSRFRFRRPVYIAGSPLRALQRVLEKDRPDA